MRENALSLTRKIEYDFLNWTSFPSSLKALNDEERKFIRIDLLRDYPISGRQKVTVEVNVKSENASPELNHIAVDTWDEDKWARNWNHFFPSGTFDWRKIVGTGFTREDANKMTITIYVGWGPDGSPCTINLDDTKIYLDDIPIFTNNFTAPLVEPAIVVASALTGTLLAMWGLS